MIKDIIKYEGIEYQVSTVNNDGVLETTIFPIENGVVSGLAIYKYKTVKANESRNTHQDILTNIENYIST